MSVRNVSLLAGVGVPVPVERDVSDALDRLEIVTAIGERGSFRLFFRLDRRSGLPAQFLFESGDLVRVVVVVSRANAASVAMDGVIVEHRISTASRDAGPVLVVSGEDLTRLMDLDDSVPRSFPGMPVDARVRVILAGYTVLGVTAVVVPPPFADVPIPADRIPRQQGTDYAYICALARSVGHQFTLDPGPLPAASIAYWGPEPHADLPRPALVIDFRKPRNIGALHLHFDAMRRVTPRAIVLDPISKTPIPIPVPDIAGLSAPLGRVVPPAHRVRRLRSSAKFTPGLAASALLAVAARSAEAMTGEGSLNVVGSQRRLRAGAIVEVRGAPEAFNGLFAVARVRDTITKTRHHQDFELVRTGLNSAAVEGPP